VQAAFGMPSTLLMMFNFSDIDSGLRFMPLVHVAMFKGELRKTTGKVRY
jgi:hypothetical protein